MKLINNTSSKRFEGKEHIQMGLDLDNTSVIMNMLRNNIYTDPIDSFIRELFSNAVDAHNRVNNTSDSIEINIITELSESLLSIRDFGASMNKEVITNTYSKMGKSDKRNTNLEQGGWGLGCKSALAYTDHFWIETFTIENSKSIYRKWVQYIDTTKIGALTLLEEKEEIDSKFRTGTKVSVPFNDKDLPKILDSLTTYLTYTKTKFDILNSQIANQLDLIKPYYNYYGDNWALNLVKTYSYENKKCQSLVILYDIPYKLDLTLLYSYLPNFKDLLIYSINNLRPSYIKEELNLSLFNGFLEALKYYSFEVILPIGSVDVSASRETLQYTEKTCIEVHKYLYKMFVEFYQNLRIDLIHHPNLVEACFNYEKYPNDLRKEVLSQLIWAKEDIKFLSRYSIFKDGYCATDNYKQYKLDSAYISKKSNYEDVLKKIDSDFIFTGSCKYIICIQDTTYKNYCKYVKYYLQKQDKINHRKTYAICIPENELAFVYNWIQDCLPTVYLSDLVINYNNNHTKEVVKKTDNGFFKCLRFYPDRKRTRAVGVNCFLNESVASQNPKSLQYYLSQEDIDNLPKELSFIPSFKINDNEAYVFISSLNNYLKEKNIEIRDLFFTTKVNRNFKHANWVNILDIIKKDYIDNKKSFGECGKHIFKYNYIRQHKAIFSLFNKKDVLLINSLYNYIHNDFNTSRLYLKRNQFLLKLILLVRPDIYTMGYKLDRTHIDDFVDFKVPEDVEKECLDFYNECNSYTKTLPFLQTYERNFYLRNCTNIDTESFLFYINVMEKELNLQKKIVYNLIDTTSSEFSNLINKIKTKFLVEEVL